MKKYLLLGLLFVSSFVGAKDIYLDQVKNNYNLCEVDYWNKNRNQSLDVLFGNWKRFSFSICGDWAAGIFYKDKLVIEGHFTNKSLCKLYDKKSDCIILESGYYLPYEVLESVLDCRK